MTILVAGASGFVGLNVLEQLLARGEATLGFSLDEIPAPATAYFRTLPGRLEHVRGDMRDPHALAALFAGRDIRAVFAGAAITAGPERERTTPAAIIEVNLAANLRLASIAIERSVKRIVFASSTAAMGSSMFGAHPITEDDAPRPTTLYGITKAGLEAAAMRLRALTGAEILVARLSAVFGPWERDTGVRDALSPLHQLARASVDHTPTRALAQGSERDWVYAPYVGEAIAWMLTAQAPEHTVYNVSAGPTWHARAFAAALEEAELPIAWSTAATAQNIVFGEAAESCWTFLAVDRIARAFRPPPPLHDALDQYARWVAGHREWYAKR